MSPDRVPGGLAAAASLQGPARFPIVYWRLSPACWITSQHRQQFHADGYMVIRGVIPLSLTANAVRDIAAFVGADLSNSATWYNSAPELDGVVPMHHAQSQWDIRQCPNLYQVFTEFFENPLLMVDINRCIFSSARSSERAHHQPRNHSLGRRPACTWSRFASSCHLVDRRRPRCGWVPVRARGVSKSRCLARTARVARRL